MTVLSGNRLVPNIIVNPSGDRTINLDLNIAKPCTVTNNGTLTVNGLVSNNKPMNFSGSGTTEFTNALNTYSGPISIRAGRLKLTGSLNPSRMNIFGTGVFEFASASDVVLTALFNNDGTLGSPNALYKIIVNGPGALTLKNNNTSPLNSTNSNFNGLIEVNGGTLKVDDPTGYMLYYPGLLTVGSSGVLDLISGFYISPQLLGSGTINANAGGTIVGGGTFSGMINIANNAAVDLTRVLPSASFFLDGSGSALRLNSTNWNPTAVFSATVSGNTTTYTADTDYILSTGGGQANVTAEVQAAGLGNDPSDFTGFVSGRIALVQRGVASFQTKVNNAAAAGASAVIIYNNTTGVTTPSVTSSVPVIMITQAIGEQLITALGSGSVTSRLDTTVTTPPFNNTLTGNGAVVKLGTVPLEIVLGSGFTGTFAIGNNGTNTSVHRLDASTNIGGTTGIVVESSAALELAGNISYSIPFSLRQTGISNAGVLRNISGNNTFSGSATLLDNTRINSDAGLLTLGGNFSGAFALTVGGAGNTTINGALTNLTTLTKDGAGTLELTAVNTYTSTTTISAGTLKLSGAGSFSQTAFSNVTNNATLVVESAEGTIHARSIGGTGTITKNLNTKVIFTGTLSHTGITTVNAGTFAVGAGSTVGDVSGSTGNFVINSGATLEINRSNAYTFPRAVSGAGSVTVLGGGTISVNNNLTHTGGTTISGGTLTIGTGSTAGAISGDIVNNANLSFNRSDAYTYAGVISGTGNLVSINGTTTLSGNNSYSGTTTVTGGAFRMGHANAFSTSSVSVGNNTSVEITGGLTVANAFILNSAGPSAVGALRSLSDLNVLNGTITLTANSNINSDVGLLTLNGNIAGAFGVVVGGAGNMVINGVLTNTTTLTKNGAGTLELTAVNTYTSTTTISAGTLKLTGVGTVGAGWITNNSALIVENNNNTTITQAIWSSGTLTKNLNTKVIFTGNLSHTGTTTVTAGTFAVGAGGTTGDMSGSGSVVINSGSTLEINRSNASTFSRPLSGAGALVVLGGGTASISNALTHTGGTTVSAGTMSIGSGSTTGSITGDIVNNAAVQFNRSDAYTYAGVISGTGNLVKAGNGTITLTGNNSYAGTTTISAGPLRIGHANALGSSTSTITTGTNIVIELIGGTSFARNISTSSTGISNGGGLRSISGNNIFDGNYTQTQTSRINSDADTLTLSNLGTLTGTFTLTLGGSGNISIQRPIAISTAGVTKDGVGTVVMSAANTYTGATTISGGTVRFATVSSLYNNTTSNWTKDKIAVNTGGVFAINVGGANEFTTTNVGTLLTNLLTTISNNGLRSGSAIGFDTTNSAGDFTISSNIVNSTGTGSGAVGVVKLGTGVLVLSGSNTYTGGTTISGGTLRAGNSTCFGTGTITLNAGAVLDRAGFTITNTVVNNGGTIIN